MENEPSWREMLAANVDAKARGWKVPYPDSAIDAGYFGEMGRQVARAKERIGASRMPELIAAAKAHIESQIDSWRDPNIPLTNAEIIKWWKECHEPIPDEDLDED